MPEILASWRPTSAWAAIATAGRGGAPGETGIHIELATAARILSVTAKAGCRAQVADFARTRLGAEIPAHGRLSAGPECDLLWSAPDQWLVRSRQALDADLIRALTEVATVTDQSDARAILVVSGAAAREALAKGFAIDLHPEVFTQGCTAVTSVAHMSVQIWQRDPGRYTIAVPRSFVAGFWAWLISASAAYGYEVAS